MISDRRTVESEHARDNSNNLAAYWQKDQYTHSLNFKEYMKNQSLKDFLFKHVPAWKVSTAKSPTLNVSQLDHDFLI